MKKKLPTVVYEIAVIINGKRHVQSTMSFTESVGEAIGEGWLENSKDEIIAHVMGDDKN